MPKNSQGVGLLNLACTNGARKDVGDLRGANILGWRFCHFSDRTRGSDT